MKRWLITIAIFVLAGAVLNVAVAWGCARWPRDILSITSKDNVALSFRDIAWWDKHVSPLFHCDAEYAYERRELGIEASMLFGAVTTQANVWAFHVASGWPAPSLSGEAWGSLDPGRPLPRWAHRRAVVVPLDSSFAIPLRPIWFGFIANTLFYAAILWLLIPGPFVLRRFIRHRRGRCAACGYPRGDSSICSECGKPLPQRAVAET